ncbi:MAG: hypothetical protein U0694_18620 [Anaerolineae bacterium]
MKRWSWSRKSGEICEIPPDAIIPPEKLVGYLLVYHDRDDRQFLARAGFTTENPELLEAAIRQLIVTEDAVVDKISQYGTHYAVVGNLIGLDQEIDDCQNCLA